MLTNPRKPKRWRDLQSLSIYIQRCSKVFRDVQRCARTPVFLAENVISCKYGRMISAPTMGLELTGGRLPPLRRMGRHGHGFAEAETNPIAVLRLFRPRRLFRHRLHAEQKMHFVRHRCRGRRPRRPERPSLAIWRDRCRNTARN